MVYKVRAMCLFKDFEQWTGSRGYKPNTFFLHPVTEPFAIPEEKQKTKKQKRAQLP